MANLFPIDRRHRDDIEDVSITSIRRPGATGIVEEEVEKVDLYTAGIGRKDLKSGTAY